MTRLITLVLAMTILTACGLKGPLYLPEKNKPVVITPATTEQTTGSAQSSSSSSLSSSSSKNSTP
ncbi:MAG TPA: lipoprotein [Steroidobacteraceae bacterium]|nr:lipoprotein [Steroidobacteraceae bacterium]